ncbi:MAG TPA: phosphotransferase [Paenibacillus sp.]|nr:phosphotransferase [Paenibacillus sp.]
MSGNAESAVAEALAHFFPGASPVWRSGASGMNNTTRFVELDGRRYVLRVYETHRDAEKVRYEHAVLLALNETAALPFAVPRPTRAPERGDTVVRLADGRLAALFGYVEGERPSLDRPEALRAFGRAAGELSVALSDVRIAAEPAYRPYYELDAAHPSIAPADADAFFAAPPEPFADLAGELRLVGEALRDARRSLPALRGLPHQLVHGDLNASNALAAPGADDIAALLDFEFVTVDLRAMEAAVCLSDLADAPSDEDALRRMAAFVDGYASAARLTPDEAAALPLLLRLRRIDVVLHFLGRWRDSVEGPEPLRGVAAGSARSLERLRRLEAPLREAFAGLTRG